MVRKLSIPVLIIIGMILCGPGASSSSFHDNPDLPVDVIKDYDRIFDSDLLGVATSYKPSMYQNRSNRFSGDWEGDGRSRGDQRRRSWQDRISDDTLLEFLKVHVKELASLLESMKKDRSRNYTDQIRALKRLYGPVIEEMKEDPKAGKMSLEKIQLRLKIQDVVDDFKNPRHRTDEHDKQKLTENVAKLFNVIVSEEEYDIDQMEEWLDHPDDRRWLSRNEYRSNRNYIEENRDDVSDWKKKKDDIVADRVKKLLQEHRDFPWGN